MTAALLTPKEAADRLNCSVVTVKALLRKNELIGSKFGMGWRIDADDLERYIEGKRNVAKVRGRSA